MELLRVENSVRSNDRPDRCPIPLRGVPLLIVAPNRRVRRTFDACDVLELSGGALRS
ncbi:MAG: hypothetical protein ABIQ18_32770 [Umezawaea sp.]